MSAHYELRLRLRLIDGTELPLQIVVLDEFVPGRAAEKAVKESAEKLAFILARAGDHSRAVAEAEELIKVGTYVPSALTLYNAAYIYALAAKAVQADAKLADTYAAQAVALLRRCQNGYRQGITFEERVRSNSDLDSLRQRDDFKMLLAPPKGNPKTSGS